MQFTTSVAVITPDPTVSRRLYLDALELPLTAEADGYLHSEHITGCKSFGVWSLTQAAQACFGTFVWPVDRPVPHASIEFEVTYIATVQVAADELNDKGFALLYQARTEPWGQTVARLQSPEGVIIPPLVRAVDASVTRRRSAGNGALRSRSRSHAHPGSPPPSPVDVNPSEVKHSVTRGAIPVDNSMM